MERLIKNEKENYKVKILTSEDDFLEESTREANAYNQDNENGNFKAYGTAISQIPFLVPSEGGTVDNIKLQLANFGLYANTTINEYEATKPYQEELKNKCASYLMDHEYENGKWLFISGQSMIGKKHLISAIAKEILKNGQFITVLNYLNMSSIKNNFIKKSASTIDKYKKADVLIILNLWHNSVNQMDISVIEQIIDYRSIHDKVTLITSDQTNHNTLEKISIEVYKNIKMKAKGYYLLIPYDPNNRFKI
jgi:DNA replication protein DnaC